MTVTVVMRMVAMLVVCVHIVIVFLIRLEIIVNKY